jgi:hypothetical protein
VEAPIGPTARGYTPTQSDALESACGPLERTSRRREGGTQEGGREGLGGGVSKEREREMLGEQSLRRKGEHGERGEQRKESERKYTRARAPGPGQSPARPAPLIGSITT